MIYTKADRMIYTMVNTIADTIKYTIIYTIDDIKR